MHNLKTNLLSHQLPSGAEIVRGEGVITESEVSEMLFEPIWPNALRHSIWPNFKEKKRSRYAIVDNCRGIGKNSLWHESDSHVFLCGW